MKIVSGNMEIPVYQVINRVDIIDGVSRDIEEIQSTVPFTAKQVQALSADTNWYIQHDGGDKTNKPFYTEPLRYSLWLGKVNPGEQALLAKEQELTAVIQEKELLTQEKTQLAQEKQVLEVENTKFVAAIPTLLEGQPASVALQFWGYFPDWAEGHWKLNQNLKYNNYPYFVYQAHNSTNNPSWNPEATPALFSPWHGVSKETALPWKQPTGAQDIYKTNEYMIFTDTKTYRCKQDTNYSPTEYAQAWELVV